MRFVSNELDIYQQRSQEREASQPAVDEHGVLADPAQAGQAGEITLQERRGVDHGPAANLGTFATQPGQQGFKLVPENAVIIEPTSVTSDFPLSGARWLGYGLTVNQAGHHHRANAFEKTIGVRADLFMFLEVTHAGPMSGLEPVLKLAVPRR